MWLLKMAWKNLWRNYTRTLISMSAIFFAVILSVLTSSLKDGVFDNLVKNVVSFYTGYIQVHKNGYWKEQNLDNSFAASVKTEQSILRDKNVSSITARLESFALVSSGELTKGCLVVGVDPEKEDKITLLKSKLTRGSYIKSSDHAVLIAEGLARRLKVTVKDTVVLIGQGYHGATAAGKYLVKGIVSFGSPELNDKALFMPLFAAQDLYGANGMVSSYILSLKDPKQLQASGSFLSAALKPGYEVMTWEEIMPEIKQHIATDSNNMRYIQGILYLLIGFGIFGTLLMMMVERKYEMGMLVAIGMKKSRLIMLLVAESILTVVIGCFFGIMASVPIVYYLNKYPIKMGGETAEVYQKFGFEAIFPTSTDSENFINQGITVLIIGLLLSLYPVYKIIRLDPVSAMKR